MCVREGWGEGCRGSGSHLLQLLEVPEERRVVAYKVLGGDALDAAGEQVPHLRRGGGCGFARRAAR